MPDRFGHEKPLKCKHQIRVAAGFSEGVQINRRLCTAKQLLNQGQTVAAHLGTPTYHLSTLAAAVRQQKRY